MKKYESVILLKSNLSEKDLDNIVNEVESKILSYGNISQKQNLGIKKLAYEVKGNTNGYYLVFQFEIKEDISSEAIKAIERLYKIRDEIIKYIVVDL